MRTIFLGSHLLARLQSQSRLQPGQKRHISYFCPSCGEVWGRIVLPSPATWDIRYRPCSSCQDQDHLPNILSGCFSDKDGDFHQLTPAKDWPSVLLRHELLTTITNLLKEAEE